MLTFEMKSKPDQDEIGYMAQELENVLPQVVGGDPNGDAQDYPMTVYYGRITPVLVAVIKEHQELFQQ